MEENKNEYMNSDDIATLLIKLYGKYLNYYEENDNYAKAIAMAIRALSD